MHPRHNCRLPYRPQTDPEFTRILGRGVKRHGGGGAIRLCRLRPSSGEAQKRLGNCVARIQPASAVFCFPNRPAPADVARSPAEIRPRVVPSGRNLGGTDRIPARNDIGPIYLCAPFRANNFQTRPKFGPKMNEVGRFRASVEIVPNWGFGRKCPKSVQILP